MIFLVQQTYRRLRKSRRQFSLVVRSTCRCNFLLHRCHVRRREFPKTSKQERGIIISIRYFKIERETKEITAMPYLLLVTRKWGLKSQILNNLVTNLIPALADLDIYNFPHYTGRQTERFGGPSPQRGNISFVANGFFYLLRSTGVMRNLRLNILINNSYLSSRILSKTLRPRQNRNQKTGSFCYRFKRPRFRVVILLPERSNK